MKGVHCSWVDMRKIREALSAGERGYQSRLEHMRCVDHSTVSTWRAACDVLDAVEGKCDLSHVSHFQPTHAREIARAFRKQEKDPSKWTDEIKEQIVDWVDRCESEELTVQELRNALLEQSTKPASNFPGCTVEDLRKLVDDGEKFGTIYTDPPWQYGNQKTRACTSKHYVTMTVEEIAALPVKELADDNAHLHLWTTNAFLRDSFTLIESWGFEYKSIFVWHKDKMGLGNYWRLNHEFMLLGVRGECPFRDRSLESCQLMPRDKHSSKPEQVRLMIEKVSPGPYLELFGRQAVKGWTVWGNQISRDMFTQGVEAI